MLMQNSAILKLGTKGVHFTDADLLNEPDKTNGCWELYGPQKKNPVTLPQTRLDCFIRAQWRYNLLEYGRHHCVYLKTSKRKKPILQRLQSLATEAGLVVFFTPNSHHAFVYFSSKRQAKRFVQQAQNFVRGSAFYCEVEFSRRQ